MSLGKGLSAEQLSEGLAEGFPALLSLMGTADLEAGDERLWVLTSAEDHTVRLWRVSVITQTTPNTTSSSSEQSPSEESENYSTSAFFTLVLSWFDCGSTELIPGAVSGSVYGRTQKDEEKVESENGLKERMVTSPSVKRMWTTG